MTVTVSRKLKLDKSPGCGGRAGQSKVASVLRRGGPGGLAQTGPAGRGRFARRACCGGSFDWGPAAAPAREVAGGGRACQTVSPGSGLTETARAAGGPGGPELRVWQATTQCPSHWQVCRVLSGPGGRAATPTPDHWHDPSHDH